ncbi:hypothetical protein VTJ49DRAFT_5507 [Mycothermus thermophilus]|uniref:VWA7 N-terminal domain-containing protein n=1 Tax=Humicola insolens TaxID=85995 RepID=A0ABR3VKC6_HUMIN
MLFTTPLFALLAWAVMAAAFATINAPALLQQNNEHEMITRLAFQCPPGEKSDGICFEPRSLDQLAGYHVNILGVAITGAGINGAVGAPDTLDPIPEGPAAHCDDADYLDIPGYPQTREQATAKLQQCVDHLRRRFREAVAAAERILDDRHRVREDMVRLTSAFGGDCTFAFPGLQSDAYARAKCSAIEGLGRALHGIQDFYAHSNWVDTHDPTQPISIANPPGLGFNHTAPFFDMRSDSKTPIDPSTVPRNLTTGCFALPDVSYGGMGPCQGRITHHDLSKDKGVIYLDGSFGPVGPDPRSRAARGNFAAAVAAAVLHSRQAWESFREELREKYGKHRGEMVVCALVRDDPLSTTVPRQPTSTLLWLDQTADMVELQA